MGRTKGVKNKEGHKAGGARKGSGRKPKAVEDRSKKEITGHSHPHFARILRNSSSTPNLDTKRVANVLPAITSTTRHETNTQAYKPTTFSESYPVVICTPDSPVWTRPPLPIPLSNNESSYYEFPSNSWSIISNNPHKAQPISDLATHGMRFTELLPVPYFTTSTPQSQFTTEFSSMMPTNTPISSPMCSPNLEISYPQSEALHWDNPRYGSVTNGSSHLFADSASSADGMYCPHPSYSPYIWPSSPVMSSSASQESPTSSYCSIESPITSLPSTLPSLKARRRPRRCAVCLMYGEELSAYACPGRGDRNRCHFSRNYDTSPIPHGDIGENPNCYSTEDVSVLNDYGKYTEYDSNSLSLRILLVDLDTAKFVLPQEEQEQPAADEEIARFVRILNNSKNLKLFISISILALRHLKDSHTFYKQDPYAVIELNGEKHQTKVEPKGGQHPVWDDEFRLDVYNTTSASDRKLKVSVFSKEYREDELIGEAEIDIGETLKKGEFDEWVTLELNKSFKGEVYLELTYYSAEPPLMRRPSKLSPKDRLSRPPITPPKERTSPYLSPHGVTVPGPGHHSASPSTPRTSSSAHSSPSSHPALDIPPSLKVPQVHKDKHSTPSPSIHVSKPLPSLSPGHHQPQQNLQDVHAQRSPPHFPQPGLSPLPLSTSPVMLSTTPPPKFQDPTLKNIPFLDVGPPFTPLEAVSTTPKPLQHVPSVLRPTNTKSSPIPVQSRAPPPLPPRPEDPDELFRRQLEESDAEFAAKLAESEGFDLERLRIEEADAELARKMAAEESEGGASHIPGGWQ
ncbi:hypothetical protein Clacol_005490 [Clathrus columnatus]|uniref:C2 domain-containing protein n=1 Tax=Clathrus columnatus TaxID=1419009 RepID=A0AAV5ADQ8_9AGAM|nr:hypothetical protein Clacol_005490 [Clathrus columnatus]